MRSAEVKVDGCLDSSLMVLVWDKSRDGRKMNQKQNSKIAAPRPRPSSGTVYNSPEIEAISSLKWRVLDLTGLVAYLSASSAARP